MQKKNISNIFTIPFSLPFLEVLAEVVLQETAHDAMALSQYQIFLPTWRAVRAFETVLQQKKNAIILPRCKALGDFDLDHLALEEAFTGEEDFSLPPILSQEKGVFILTQLLQAYGHQTREAVHFTDMRVAVPLAQMLWGFLNFMIMEKISFDRLDHIVPEALSVHWQVSLSFFQLLREHWPKLLQEAGGVMPATYLTLAVQKRLAQWTETPPSGPIIVAGSTGSMPMTAMLMGFVSRLPKGRVVLPGFDRFMTHEKAQSLAPAHPQYTMQRFLKGQGIGAEEVQPLCKTMPDEEAFLHHIFTPSGHVQTTLERPFIETCVAATGQQEAAMLAIAIRTFLEVPHQTIKVITVDRVLTARVMMLLKQWDVQVQDSGGIPLPNTPFGTFVFLTAAWTQAPLSATALLAILKHPLTQTSWGRIKVRRWVRLLERYVLRQDPPVALVKVLTHLETMAIPQGVAEKEWQDLKTFYRALEDTGNVLCQVSQARTPSLASLVKAHESFMQFLCPDVLTTTSPEGRQFWEHLKEGLGYAPPCPAHRYAALLKQLMGPVLVRDQRADFHPRVHILGTLEARLIPADVVIMSGMVEGLWPKTVQEDPWFSMTMREAMGFSPKAMRIGLAAHDFLQGLGAKRILLTRADRVRGAPAVPSRFWETLHLAATRAQSPLKTATWLENYVKGMHVIKREKPVAQPNPKPPVEIRPRDFSTTEVGHLLTDPYRVYAKKVLHLEPLPSLDDVPLQRAFGIAMHNVLQRLLNGLETHTKQALLEQGQGQFKAHFLSLVGALPEAAYWVQIARRMMIWFLDYEAVQATTIQQNFTEIKGTFTFILQGNTYTLKSRVDRILLDHAGTLSIIDYKTGNVPSMAAVRQGFSPQLPLEAALVKEGVFPNVPAMAPLVSLAYLQLKGQGEIGTLLPLKESPDVLAHEAMAGFQSLLYHFSDMRHGYLAQPFGKIAYSPYTHLARVDEWMASVEEQLS